MFPAYSVEDWQAAVPDDVTEAHRLFLGHSSFENMTLWPPSTLRLTVLRHPVEFYVSAFNHFSNRPGNRRFDEFESSGMTFERFVREIMHEHRRNPLPKSHSLGGITQCIRLIGPSRIREIARVHFDQAEQRVDEAFEDEVIAVATRNLSRFDLVGTTDGLDRFAERLCRHCGWPAQSLPRDNTAEAHNPRHKPILKPADLSEDLKQEVLRVARCDLAAYRKACELSAAPAGATEAS